MDSSIEHHGFHKRISSRKLLKDVWCGKEEWVLLRSLVVSMEVHEEGYQEADQYGPGSR